MPGLGQVVNGVVGLPTARQLLALNGNTFVATNPTPGTAVAFANKTSFSATANGLWSISNQNPLGGRSIVLDRLRLIQTATAPTGGLVTRFEVFQETGIVALTGAALAVVPVNINQAYSNSTGAVVTFFSAGAGTIAAAVGARRQAFVGWLASGVNVTHDSWTIEFGADGYEPGIAPLTAARATDPSDLVAAAEAVVIAPGCSAWMNLWGITPAANVPSYEWSLTYNEI